MDDFADEFVCNPDELAEALADNDDADKRFRDGWYDGFDEVAYLEASPIPRHGGLPITGRDLLDEPVLPGDRR